MSKLHPDDCKAVDILLDQGQGSMGFASSTSVDHARIGAVQKVLGLLDLLTSDEPASDLVTRTIQKAGASTDTNMPLPAFGQGLGDQLPHA